MSAPEGASSPHDRRAARVFDTSRRHPTTRLGEGITLTAGVTAGEGGAFSTYTARFAAAERAPLPAPYAEVWVVLSGALRIGPPGEEVQAVAGQYLHVPEHSPGHVEAIETTVIIAVSVPAH